MPTNLPPEYFEAERRFRESVSDREKIACLEELLGTIPKHKGTDKLRADYRRKLSKLKSEAEAKKKTGRHASAYHVEKEGPVRVVVVGAPNVGKRCLPNPLACPDPATVSEGPGPTGARSSTRIPSSAAVMSSSSSCPSEVTRTRHFRRTGPELGGAWLAELRSSWGGRGRAER